MLQSYDLHIRRHPLSRSYGAKLPSSLTRVLPFALVYSTHLPVSVCGTVTNDSTLRGFSRQLGLTTSALKARIRASAQPVFTGPQRLHAYTCTTNRRLVYLAASPHRSSMVVPEC